ncbi:hypothetical protein, partial [Nostoc sp. UIC 10630]|uniref:hypothetical protein n=1 Tax=Nostoc sp. UIC 10630 TaxID=2100146 RepID=UPI001A9C4673
MPLLKNKEALKIQPLQIELTIRNLKPAATGTSSRKPKTCIAQAIEEIPMVRFVGYKSSPTRLRGISR